MLSYTIIFLAPGSLSNDSFLELTRVTFNAKPLIYDNGYH